MASHAIIWIVFTVLRCILYTSVQAVNLTNVTLKHIQVDVSCKNNPGILCAMMYKYGACCTSFRIGGLTIALSETRSDNTSSRFHNGGIVPDTVKTISVEVQGTEKSSRKKKNKYLLIHTTGEFTLYFVAASGKDKPIVKKIKKYGRIERAVFCPIGNPLKFIVPRKQIISLPLPGSAGKPETYVWRYGQMRLLTCDGIEKLVFIATFNEIYKGSMKENKWVVILRTLNIQLFSLQTSRFLYWGEWIAKSRKYSIRSVDYNGHHKKVVTQHRHLHGLNIDPTEPVLYACVRSPMKFHLIKTMKRTPNHLFQKTPTTCMDIQADMSRVYLLNNHEINFYDKHSNRFVAKIKLKRTFSSSATIQVIEGFW